MTTRSSGIHTNTEPEPERVVRQPIPPGATQVPQRPALSDRPAPSQQSFNAAALIMAHVVENLAASALLVKPKRRLADVDDKALDEAADLAVRAADALMRALAESTAC